MPSNNVRDVRNEYDAAVRKVQRTDKLPPKVLFVCELLIRNG